MRHDPTPTLDRNRNREKRTVPKFLREDQFERLLISIETDAKLKPSITHGNLWLSRPTRFTVESGLRRGEVCNLRWSAVDLKSGFVYVVNINDEEDASDFETKSGHERAVPLVGDARAVIEELHEERTTEADDYVFKGANGRQLNAEHLSKRFRDYRGDKQAKLPKEIHFHSLRHTFASWWVQRGGDLYRLKEVLGHSSIEQTMIYAHLRPDALQEEMLRCFEAEAKPDPTEELEKLRAKIEALEEENARLRAGEANEVLHQNNSHTKSVSVSLA